MTSRVGRVTAAHPGALVAAVASLMLVVLVGLPLPASAATRRAGTEVAVRVDSVSPVAVRPTYTVHRLRVRLTLTNETDRTLTRVTVTAMRGAPLKSLAEFDAALAHPVDGGSPVRPVRPLTLALAPAGSDGDSASATFVTTTDLSVQSGFCLCADRGMLPIVLDAHATIDGADQIVGSAQAFVPSFYKHTTPAGVSWVWPLIDRPHRLTHTSTFLDDDLATSVSTGRLDRCMQVLEQVAPKVPVTLVIDPELLDELEIMATTKYRYYAPDGSLVPGTGSSAAQSWLARLQAVLSANPQVSVALTAQADPDVDVLARAGLGWRASLPAPVLARVEAALGGVVPTTTFAWPPSGVIGTAALSGLVGGGVDSLLLSSRSVTRNVGPEGLPVSLARLRDGGTQVVAALIDPPLEADAIAAVTGAGDPTPGAALNQLIARIGARLAQRPGLPEQNVVLAAPRYVDPDVADAVAAITASSRTMLTRPMNLLGLLAGAMPVDAGTKPPTSQPLPGLPDRLRSGVAGAATSGPTVPPLPAASVRIATAVQSTLGALHSLFPPSSGADARLADLTDAVQRIESAAWAPRAIGGRPSGVGLARELRLQVRHIVAGVHIVQPSSRSYTLASTNTPIPITVENDLAYPVSVRVAVRTANSIPGLDTQKVSPQTVAPHTKVTLHVPTQVQRSGTFRIVAFLLTPDGEPLGHVMLTVHSTVLGTIGVVITIVAGAVLALALLVRLVRRLVARRRRRDDDTPWLPKVEPAPTVTPTGSA